MFVEDNRLRLLKSKRYLKAKLRDRDDFLKDQESPKN